MDLSFPRFDSAVALDSLPDDLAALMAVVAARQAASPTSAGHARSKARISIVRPEPTLLSPLDGAFNGPMARVIAHWRAS